MIKKINVFIIICSFILNALPVFATEEKDFTVDYKELESMEIITKEDIKEAEEESLLTRGKLAFYLCKLKGEDTDLVRGNKVIYKDVPPKDRYYPYISYMTEQGILRGYEDGCFYPEKEVTGIEAIASLINLSGYSYKANLKGGWPLGYTICADEINLTKGITIYNKRNIMTDEFFKLMQNSLDIPLVILKSVKDEPSYEISKDKTIRTYYLSCFKNKGTVTSNNFISIDYNYAGENSVIINSEEMKCKNPDFINYVGYNVSYIYKKDKGSDEKILVYLKPENNKVVNIKRNDYVDFKDNILTYLENDKEKNINIKKNVKIFKNNAEITPCNDVFKNIKDGEITLVASKNDYSVIHIFEYKTIFADNIDTKNKIIRDKLDFSLYVDCSEKTGKKVTVKNKEGETISFEDIKKGSVLTVKESKNTVDIMVSYDTSDGVLKESSKEDSEDIYRIGDSDYKLIKGRKYNHIKIGSNVIIYKDVFDRIGYIELSENEKLTYAYIINTGAKKEDTEEKIYAKIYTVDDGVETLKISDKAKINDISVKDMKDYDEFIKILKKNNGSSEEDIVAVIKKNKDNEIREIETAKKPSLIGVGEDGFTELYPFKKRQYYQYSLSFEYKVYLTSEDTPMMYIPKNPKEADENKFRTITGRNLSHRDEFIIASYAYGKDKDLGDLIVFKEASGGISSQSLPREESMAVVKSISSAVKETGEEVKRVRTFKNNKDDYFDFFTDDDLTSNGFNIQDTAPGDVLRYTVDSDKNLVSFDMRYDESENKMLVTYGASLRDTVVILKSDVVKINNDFITINHNNDLCKFRLNSMPVVTYVSNKKDRTTAWESKISDIQVGDIVMLQLSGYQLNNIFVLEK